MDEIFEIAQRDINNRGPHFMLRKLVVKKQCYSWLLKNLKPDEYVFSEREYDGFYGKRVAVSAIVGMNGSGKSTLLELIFRMVNNVGVMMSQNIDDSVNAPQLYYVMGIYADLYYIIDATPCCLLSRGTWIGLDLGDLKVKFGSGADEKDLKGFTEYNHVGDNELRKVSALFFYTLVNNYSMQAYDAHDYSRDMCSKVYRGDSLSFDNVSWINRVFHKNDGYVAPISLNPLRENGVIDMYNLSLLTEQRLEGILVEYKSRGKDILDNYSLATVNYKIDKEKLLKGFPDEKEDHVPFPYVEKSRQGKNTPPDIDLDKKLNRIISKLKEVCKNRDSYAAVIFNRYKLALIEEDDDLLWMAGLYLVKKVQQIAVSYPAYEEYKEVGANGVFRVAANKEERCLVKRFVKHLQKDPSHVTLKIFQTIRFYKQVMRNNNANLERLKSSFNYDDYVNLLWEGRLDVNSVRARIRLLPPPFFSREIMMRGNKTSHTMSVGRMSSGERQFLYSMSTVIYHLNNILTVPKDMRIAYRNILLVLDEVEICYHPEYQRQFVNRLVEMFRQTNLPSLGSIYVLVTTHSPFILSDIPKDSILYLKGGKKQDSDTYINPFCANVNDILKQSFFLESGFIGDFAQRKIKSFVTFLESFDGNRDANMLKAQELVDMVGDPIIRENLQCLLDDVLRKYPQFDSRERKLKRRDELLKQLKDMGFDYGENIHNSGN